MYNSMRLATLLVILMISGIVYALKDEYIAYQLNLENQEKRRLAMLAEPVPTPEVLQPVSNPVPVFTAAPIVQNALPMVYACKTQSGQMQYQQKPCDANTVTMAAIEQLPVSEPVRTPYIKHVQVDFDAQDRERLGSTVAVMGSTQQKPSASECKFIEDNRDYVRSQQRINSTQYLRDQYDYWTKRRNDAKC
ncbi:hypothetical protein HZU75_16660 [Chitinibacter fontanus]|uniref:DUF4124 domain-containing protein n=1 Tax=Chitinibacter fontanus TaxID=1737446 RepID=A0A7D5Z9P0_9NEIS|nr:hypothetical protein [Chitinibacter fontanus]QLI83023.1 hypothetical protein HZU75_16660 [Chitinibacter fontanus]